MPTGGANGRPEKGLNLIVVIFFDKIRARGVPGKRGAVPATCAAPAEKRKNKRRTPPRKTRSPSGDVKNLTLDPKNERATGMSSGISPVHHFYCPPCKKSTWATIKERRTRASCYTSPENLPRKILEGIMVEENVHKKKVHVFVSLAAALGINAFGTHTTNIKGASGRIGGVGSRRRALSLLWTRFIDTLSTHNLGWCCCC